MSNRRPKLIGTDLDGTIVSHYGDITQRTIDAFYAAHNAGIEIFFVTGRPPRWMEEIAQTFTFGNAICANGAQLLDLRTMRVLEEWAITVDIQKEIVSRLREAVPGISFAVEYRDEFHHEKSYVPRWDVGIDIAPAEKIEERITEPAFKMLARCSNYEFTSDEILHRAQLTCGELVTLTHSNAKESLIEISAVGVSKGETLSKLAHRAGISAEDTVTFGDNPNDFSMLRWAHRSWTFADAHPDAKNHAKFVTDAHSDDGVAKIIEELIKLPA